MPKQGVVKMAPQIWNFEFLLEFFAGEDFSAN